MGRIVQWWARMVVQLLTNPQSPVPSTYWKSRQETIKIEAKRRWKVSPSGILLDTSSTMASFMECPYFSQNPKARWLHHAACQSQPAILLHYYSVPQYSFCQNVRPMNGKGLSTKTFISLRLTNTSAIVQTESTKQKHRNKNSPPCNNKDYKKAIRQEQDRCNGKNSPLCEKFHQMV